MRSPSNSPILVLARIKGFDKPNGLRRPFRSRHRPRVLPGQRLVVNHHIGRVDFFPQPLFRLGVIVPPLDVVNILPSSILPAERILLTSFLTVSSMLLLSSKNSDTEYVAIFSNASPFSLVLAFSQIFLAFRYLYIIRRSQFITSEMYLLSELIIIMKTPAGLEAHRILQRQADA